MTPVTRARHGRKPRAGGARLSGVGSDIRHLRADGGHVVRFDARPLALPVAIVAVIVGVSYVRTGDLNISLSGSWVGFVVFFRRAGRVDRHRRHRQATRKPAR